MRVHYDLTPRELAGLFYSKDWPYGKGYPSEKDIQRNVAELASSLASSQSGSYAESGRLVLWKDADFQMAYDIALKVGYIDDFPADADLDSVSK
jgi:hypothetical protein